MSCSCCSKISDKALVSFIHVFLKGCLWRQNSHLPSCVSFLDKSYTKLWEFKGHTFLFYSDLVKNGTAALTLPPWMEQPCILFLNVCNKMRQHVTFSSYFELSRNAVSQLPLNDKTGTHPCSNKDNVMFQHKYILSFYWQIMKIVWYPIMYRICAKEIMR